MKPETTLRRLQGGAAPLTAPAGGHHSGRPPATRTRAPAYVTYLRH